MALCGVIFAARACPVTRHELVIHTHDVVGVRRLEEWLLDGISAEKAQDQFFFLLGGCALVVLFPRHVFESRCAFRLLIPPVPTWTSVSQSGQCSLLSAVS